MKKQKRYPIKRKLMRMGMDVSIAAIVMASLVFVGYNTFVAHNHLRHELSLVSKVVAQRAAAGLNWGDKTLVSDSLKSFDAKESIKLACVYDPRGKIFTTYKNNVRPCPEKPKEESTYNKISILHKVTFEGDVAGELYIESDLRDVKSAFPKYSFFSFLVICISIGLAYILSSRHQRSLSSPILHLSEIMTRVTKDKAYNLKVTKYQNDEIGDMADAFNKMLGVVYTSNEELEKKVAERTANLEKAMKSLEDALKAKDNFLKNMSHEFKTPAYQILHFAEKTAKIVAALVKQFDKYSKKRKKGTELAEIEKQLNELCDVIGKLTLACETESRFIQNMSDLNSLTKDEVDYHIETNDLHEVVKDTLLGFKNYADRFVYKNTEPMKCLFDKNKTKRVLEHLFSNALTYAPESNITISLEKVKYRTEDKKSRVGIRCSIADKGPGIAENELEYIFENFVEGSRTKTTAGGRGMGLAISRGYIKGMKGIIWAESTPNKEGAVFHFVLPVN